MNIITNNKRFKIRRSSQPLSQLAKTKINDVMFKNIYDLKGFTLLEQFLANFRVIISPTFDDYMERVEHKNRRLVAYGLNILDYLMIIRFAIISYVNKPWIWTSLGDAFYLWGSTGYVTAALAFFGCAIASINSLYLILETNQELYTIEFIQNIRKGRDGLDLGNRYYKRFCVRLKFCTKILNPALIGCAFVPVAAHLVTTVISCLIDNVHKSVIPLIISNVLIAIWMTRGTAMGLGGSLLIYLIVQYLKYAFRQLNESIDMLYRFENSRQLTKAIEKHQKITLLVKKMNRVISYVFGFTYISCTPPMNILFFLGLQQHLHPLVRTIYLSVAIQIVLIIFLLNLMASSFSSMAHNSIDIMYKFLIKSDLSFNTRIKISSFVEKLKGHTIGFYCFNLFALDNYRFYQYVSSFFTTYLLIYQFKSFYQEFAIQYQDNSS